MESQEFESTEEGTAPEEMLQSILKLLRGSKQFIVIGRGLVDGKDNSFVMANCTDMIVPIISSAFESKPEIMMLFKHAMGLYEHVNGKNPFQEMLSLLEIAKKRSATEPDIDKAIRDLLKSAGKNGPSFNGKGGDA